MESNHVYINNIHKCRYYIVTTYIGLNWTNLMQNQKHFIRAQYVILCYKKIFFNIVFIFRSFLASIIYICHFDNNYICWVHPAPPLNHTYLYKKHKICCVILYSSRLALIITIN